MKRTCLNAFVLMGNMAAALLLIPATSSAAGPAKAGDRPAARPPSSPQARKLADILAEIKDSEAALRDRFSSRFDLLDPGRRREAEQYAVPLLRNLIARLAELKSLNPRAATHVASETCQYWMILSSLGYADALASLEAAAKGEDQVMAVPAAAGCLATRWIAAAGNVAEQKKIVQAMQQLAHQNAQNDNIMPMVVLMYRQGAADSDLRRNMAGVLIDELKGPKARAMAEQVQRQLESQELEGKPLVLSGITVDGKPFSTADWKGKVVLVDFWATWCAPCRAELPKIEKVYADYHGKGMEIVGISCDRDMVALRAFLAKNGGMTWPQLVDSAGAGSPTLVQRCKVRGIPTLMLIDKNGILCSATAREDYERMIPMLLEEK